jgi:quercetin dioxygenase-like cupin family protein
MPVLLKSPEDQKSVLAEKGRVGLLDASVLNSDFCEVNLVLIDPEQPFVDHIGSDDLVWFQVLRGSGTVEEYEIDAFSVVFAGPSCVLRIEATLELELLWTRVPRAHRFDTNLSEHADKIQVIDWGNEPVLQSEHDARTRIYVSTPKLIGTSAIKAEIISYPAGTSAPEHHHEGAEHFQYVLSGSGTAVLEGVSHALKTGDILYNYPNERHWFYTNQKAEENFVFVELFIPGHCTTIWTEGAKACAWLPTGSDTRGDKPSREIKYHIHGQDTGL